MAISLNALAFWVKRNTTGAEEIINIDGTDEIEFNASNQITDTSWPAGSTIYVDGVAGATTINDTDWHHVAITNATGINATTFEIGRGATPTYFNGKIDDVRVYDRVLSAKEVKRLYELGATTQINKTLITSQSYLAKQVRHLSFDGSNFSDQPLSEPGGLIDSYSTTTSTSDSAGIKNILIVGDDLYTLTGPQAAPNSGKLFVEKRNKDDLSIIWSTSTDSIFGSDWPLYGNRLAHDGNNLYMIASCSACAGGANGFFTMKIDTSDGTTLWSTTTNPTSSFDYASAITTDGTDVYVTGYCSGSADCDSLSLDEQFTYKIDASMDNHYLLRIEYCSEDLVNSVLDWYLLTNKY